MGTPSVSTAVTLMTDLRPATALASPSPLTTQRIAEKGVLAERTSISRGLRPDAPAAVAVPTAS